MKFKIGLVAIELDLTKMLNGTGVEVQVMIPVNEKVVEIKLDWQRMRRELSVNLNIGDGIPF